MEVCFYCADQNPQRDRSLGITNYTIGLLKALATSSDISLSGMVSRSSFPLPVMMETHELPFRTDRMLGRLIADNLHPLFSRTGAAIWHYPKGFLPLTCQVKAKRVGTIADTILQHYADQYPNSRGRIAFAYWLRTLKHSIERFDLILTVSEFSKRCIQEFCARYSLRSPEIVVTYEGANVDPLTQVEVKKQNYVVHLASTHPHKRTKWLLDTWAELQNNGTRLPPLRLIGKVPSAVDLSKIRNIEVSNSLAATEYTTVIASAKALILPSEIEGFGLPALEAYLLGTPVAYVRNTAVAEILGENTPGAFDFGAETLANAIWQILELSGMAIKEKTAELRSRFDWRRVADKTRAAYRDVLKPS
jgi:glycosyltransferase involved in cell wall biosynthesis